MKGKHADTLSHILLFRYFSLSESAHFSVHRQIYKNKQSFVGIRQWEQIGRHTVAVCRIINYYSESRTVWTKKVTLLQTNAVIGVTRLRLVLQISASFVEHYFLKPKISLNQTL